MIKEIYQIAIGSIPVEIEEAMETVRNLAVFLGVPYVLDTEVPEQYQGYDYRIASNYMRIDRMVSHPGSFYLDWDCIVKENFTIDREQILVPYIDNMVFLTVETATRVREIMGNIADHPKVAGSIFNAFRVIFTEDWEKSGCKLSYKEWLYTVSSFKNDFYEPPVKHFRYTMDKGKRKGLTMNNGQKQQSARDFVAISLGTMQQSILNMIDGAEAQIIQQQQQIESQKKEIEELKIKLQPPKE